MSKKNFIHKICNNNFPIINIGTGEIYSIKQLANIIKFKLGYKGNIVFDKNYPNGVLKKNLNNNKIKKLGWSPKISLQELVSEMVREDFIIAQRDSLIKAHGYNLMDYHE